MSKCFLQSLFFCFLNVYCDKYQSHLESKQVYFPLIHLSSLMNLQTKTWHIQWAWRKTQISITFSSAYNSSTRIPPLTLLPFCLLYLLLRGVRGSFNKTNPNATLNYFHLTQCCMKGALQLAALFDTSLSSDPADKCITILAPPFHHCGSHIWRWVGVKSQLNPKLLNAKSCALLGAPDVFCWRRMEKGLMNYPAKVGGN